MIPKDRWQAVPIELAISQDPCAGYGFPANHWIVTSPTGPWEYEHTGVGRFWTCLGRFNTKEEAEAYKARLEDPAYNRRGPE